MYDGNLGEIDFGSSQREVPVSEGSSYRESTVFISLYFSGWWGQCESSKPSLYVPRFRAIVDLIANQTPSLHVVCLQEFWFHDDVMDLFHAQFDKK